MSSMQLLKDNEGQSYIPPSQRPDGSWRKPIRVKDGYVPQEEQPVYISKGRQYGNERSTCPVGLSPSDLESFKSSKSGGFPISYFDVGDLKPTAAIPGLNFVQSDDPLAAGGKTKSKKSKSKTKSVGGGATDGSPGNTATTTPQGKGQASAAAAAGAASSTQPPASTQQTDPVKRLRNLKKRLRDIEELEKRISSGELSSPEKEQIEKMRRKGEVLDEIDDLEELVAKLSVS